jgi:branched-chain amino acid transport system permease protein
MPLHADLETLLSGVLQGGVIALLAISMSLVFGVMRIVNFAQADFMMLGMYGVVTLSPYIPGPALLTGLLVFIPGSLFGFIVYRLLLSRSQGGAALGGFQHSQFLLTFALSLVIESIVQTIWGSTPRNVIGPDGDSNIVAWSIAGLSVDRARLFAFIASVILGIVLLVFLRVTQTGRRIRATAADDMAAQIVGINVSRVRTVVFAASVGLAGVAGGVLVGYFPATPDVGSSFLFYMFAALALGGLGNVLGALLGGLVIGIAQAIAELTLPLQLTDVAVFCLFLVVISVRPTGLLSKAVRI